MFTTPHADLILYKHSKFFVKRGILDGTAFLIVTEQLDDARMPRRPSRRTVTVLGTVMITAQNCMLYVQV